MPPHEYDAITVTLQIAGHTFVLKENVTTVLGFKSIRQGESITEMQQPFSEGDEVKISKTNIREHETTPPEYFNEGSLLKAMENPQNFIQLKDKKYAQTLKQTGGIGTVATRADIIDKLFNMNAIESRDGKIKVTSKGKQILELAPEELTSPLLTAQWEEKLLLIERGKYQAKTFINEMKDFTKDVVNGIKK